MYDEKESQADNSLRFTTKKAGVGVDYNTREPRYKSQYTYGIDWVRPKVHIADSTHGLPATDSLVEPIYKETMKDHALTAARSVVRPREIVPVRLMNVSEDSKVLHRGTLIGKLTEIGEVQSPLP